MNEVLLWVLIMLTPTPQGTAVNILGTYGSPKVCESELQRAGELMSSLERKELDKVSLVCSPTKKPTVA
jgi:hypothetical protein